MAFYLTLMGSRGEGWCQGSPESHGLCPVLGRSLERIGGRSLGGILLTRAHGVHWGSNSRTAPPHPKAQSTLNDGGIPGKGSEVFMGTAGAAGEMQPCSTGGGGADRGCLWAFLGLELLLQPQASLPSKVKGGRILSPFLVGVGGAIT